MTKNIWITGFALFSLFFGAGNLILPPYLGLTSGNQWLWVTLGFLISAVILPLLGILVHARLQGTMMDFGKKVGPVFSLVYCCLIYAISITLPSPRTASVTHEMAIAPISNTGSLLTSGLYFALVLLFVLNRSRILNIIGKYLGPLLILVVISVITVATVTIDTGVVPVSVSAPVISGLLEGYQTFDTIGATVVGGVIIISLKQKFNYSYPTLKNLLFKSAFVAAIGLLLIYSGLIYSGALLSSTVDTSTVNRTEFLTLLSTETLGRIGTYFLSLLVTLACFTTAVGIITGTADFVKGIWKESPLAYYFTAVFACFIGVFVGQLDVSVIIKVAIPALLFIYPITIVLIILHLLPASIQTTLLFRGVVLITTIGVLPDFLGSIGFKEQVTPFLHNIPLGDYTLGWLLPSLVTGIIISMYTYFNQNKFSV
ncbi:branched-chain amino acid transport system II carrier protein [Aquimarina sp. ERC-38]|uniref:branched-chain amino acid transport system II carrier protein n=1 Tax=Aquimarina sp. ERC-38 TaxID=2949996 RepID=UPI002247284C|nr:branched-chain amino acid transport system II carrier protein [Aquimarina sp. ERC-38]UZO81795.1 branched-chain amino acid transport system II carrier protein [Aquimarina sp. ERC-38]